MISISISFLGQTRTSLPPITYDNQDFHNPLWQTYFRLDELDRAEDWLRSRGVVFTTAFKVEIFDDGVFQFDRAEDIARRMASAFLNGVTQELISQSDRFIDVWKHVRRLASGPFDVGSQGALVTMVAGAAEDVGYEPLRAKLLAAAEDWSTNVALSKAAAPNTGGLRM